MKGIRWLFPILLASCSYNQSEQQNSFIKDIQYTDQSGKVVFNAGPIIIKDSHGTPLPGITVMYLLNSETSEFIITAIDSRSEERRKFHVQTLEGRLVYDSQITGERKSSLFSETSIVLSTIQNFRPLYEEATNGPGVFMGSDENVDVYCVSKDEILRTQVEVPLGIVTMGNSRLKIGLTTRVKNFFDKFVFREAGQHPAYEIRTPRNATNLCSSPDYSGDTVCTLDYDSLSRQLWQSDGMPVWKINGPCDLKDLSTNQKK